MAWIYVQLLISRLPSIAQLITINQKALDLYLINDDFTCDETWTVPGTECTMQTRDKSFTFVQVSTNQNSEMLTLIDNTNEKSH